MAIVIGQYASTPRRGRQASALIALSAVIGSTLSTAEGLPSRVQSASVWCGMTAPFWAWKKGSRSSPWLVLSIPLARVGRSTLGKASGSRIYADRGSGLAKKPDYRVGFPTTFAGPPSVISCGLVYRSVWQ